MEPYDSLDAWSNYPRTLDPHGSSFIAPNGESNYYNIVVDLSSKVDDGNDCSLIKNEEDYAILENFRKNYEKKLLSDFGFSNTLYDSLQNEDRENKVSNNGLSTVEENEVWRDDENKVSNDGLSMIKENEEWMDIAPKNEENKLVWWDAVPENEEKNKVSNDGLWTIKKNEVSRDIIAPKNEEKYKVSSDGLSTITENELLVWLDFVPEPEENNVSNDGLSMFKENELLVLLGFVPETEENKVSNDGLSTTKENELVWWGNVLQNEENKASNDGLSTIKANELGWWGNVPQNEENKASNDGLSKENKVSRDYIAPKNKEKKVLFEDISPRNGNNNLIILDTSPNKTNKIRKNTLEQSSGELGFGKTKKMKKMRRQPKNYVSGTDNLVDHSTKKCEHCQTKSTPQWRNGPSDEKNLCNACGTQYKIRGGLSPDYRPAASPNFDPEKYSNYHKRILKKQSKKEKQRDETHKH